MFRYVSTAISDLGAQRIYRYLSVRICQFGKNLCDNIMAKGASIIMLWQIHQYSLPTEIHLFTKLLWTYCWKLHEKNWDVVIYQWKTLPEKRNHFRKQQGKHSHHVYTNFTIICVWFLPEKLAYLSFQRMQLGTCFVKSTNNQSLSFIFTKIVYSLRCIFFTKST